ncbi:MAG TPA: hypothetical protein VN285_01765 [Candidatus Deferrimicrobium sp.]|nr:hypothetical protein [Candidatus Deferrimicrobium sp.]
MTVRLPESAIESAIEQLKGSPAKFQRLAEDYARLTYPDRFTNIRRSGRHGDVTVKGWPDAYSPSSDGRMDVLEATHSPDWQDHLDTDLEKAEAMGNGRLSGFLFVAWDNDPSLVSDKRRKNPRNEKLMTCRDRLTALDIPAENIRFVFKKQLVSELRQPRFANVLKDILGLPCHCLPFRVLNDEKRIYGSERRLDIFAPAKEEYLNDLVHRPAIADEIEKRLKHPGWALILGRGATGKTVLAIQFGLVGYESKAYPVYYLDLADTDAKLSDAIDVITMFGDDAVLFIIDNVHLDEDFARQVFEHWQSTPLGSHLLLLGRDVSAYGSTGTARPLDDLREEALVLRVQPDDLAGVFRRLAHRVRPSPVSAPTPPREALERWNELFGGDLIAFSAAVAHRINQLMQGDWQLQAQDAATHMRETYLARVDEAESINLFRIAVFAQLELKVPEEAITLAKIRAFLLNGLVHCSVRGPNRQYKFYQLVHPGLGDLLLTAADYSGHKLNQFISEQSRYVAQINPIWGFIIAARLESANRTQEALTVLKSVIEQDEVWVTSVLAPGLQNMRSNCERLVRLKISVESEIDTKLTTEHSALVLSALRTPLHFLASFLNYAEHKLPEVYTCLATALVQPENLQTLGSTALRTPLGNLAAFLKYAELKFPDLYALLAAALSQPENLQTLSTTALRTPLGDLTSFLQYAERNLPKVYACLATALVQPENLQTLSATALRTPCHFLVSFLEYVELKFPDVYRIIAVTLTQSESLQTLGSTALSTSLGNLAAFLEFAERKIPKVYNSLVAALTQPENLQTLGSTALRTPLSDLASFLEFAERKFPKVYNSLAAALTQPESLQTLGSTALRTPLGNLAAFLEYAELKFPDVYALLAAALSQPEHLQTLGATALRTPLGDLAAFLEYAEHKFPDVYRIIAAALTQSESLQTLGSTALSTSLGNLAAFLEFAEHRYPKVYTSLAVTLVQSENLQILIARALRTSLCDLAFFLEFAERKFPKVYNSLAAALTQPENLQTLGSTALRTPLSDLASFLEYAEHKLPDLRNSLYDRIEQSEGLSIIAEVACSEPLSSLLKFLKTTKVAAALVGAIDGRKWVRLRLGGGSEQPSFFPDLVGVFRRLGRPELGEAPARALIIGAEQQHWHVTGIGLNHLSHIMRLGRETGTEHIRAFLTRIVTPAWLKTQYEEAPAFGIAACIFALWGYYQQSILDHFCTEALESRVNAEIQYLNTHTPERLKDALELLGCSTLIGMHKNMRQIEGPGVSQVREVIRLTAPKDELTAIGHIQIQVWLGLREMARLWPEHINVQAEIGNQVLVLWRQSTGYTNKQNVLNRWMIDWLEQCAQTQWTLIPDHTPLPEE